MQLIGRSGRQGDPGESCFAVTPEDECAEVGQTRAEELDAELRMTVRLLTASWMTSRAAASMREACDTSPVAPQLKSRSRCRRDAHAASPRDREALLSEVNGLILEACRGRQAPSTDDRARAEGVAPTTRRGAWCDDAFAEIARIVLSQFADHYVGRRLDTIEARKGFARLSLGLDGDPTEWRLDVERSYRCLPRR